VQPGSKNAASLAFGRFQIFPHRRELLADGHLLKVGGRAFDVLMTLIEARGAIVDKDTLMARVWPGRIVEENALQSHISDLRAAFGADRDLIRTVSGRGYQFVGEIRAVPADQGERPDAAVAAYSSAQIPTNLPQPVSELIGRDDEVREIVSLVADHRLVTLTGPGGIGKTRLALAVARELLPRFTDGVWVVELSLLTDPGLVAATVAAAVGLEIGPGEISARRVARALADRQLLLILDTCEHVISAAANLAETVLQISQAVRLLATSREPLESEGEWVYPVPPLAVPAENFEKEEDLLSFGAVHLFLERARAANPRFTPNQRLLEGIAAICRRLDGMPLAIEMAAARTSTLAIDEIAVRLADRFQLLTARRRTASPRHQTLHAAFDWSHELLTVIERVILRRLGVFAGYFSLDAASSIAASPPEIAPWGVVEALSSLVAKSLVVAEPAGAAVRFRLLDTTRAYALERLEESGEREALARRHAEYGRSRFEQAEAELEMRPASDWLAENEGAIENLRAALDWAFSPSGDPSIGVALTVAAVPLWMQLSLVEECRRRVEQALRAIAGGVETDALHEMKLYAALGASLIYTRGGGPEIASAWTKALEIAESLGNAEYQMRSLWGLWSFHVNGVQYHTALTLARRYFSLAAAPEANDQLVGERMIGVSYHYLGDQQSARRHLERALTDAAAPETQRQVIRLQLDPRVTARVHLARVSWLQGFPDRAMREAEHSIEDARAVKHAISFSYAVARAACPIALWVGDLAAADYYAEMLRDHSKRHALAHWELYGRGYQAAVAAKRGDVATGLRLFGASSEELRDSSISAPRFMRFTAAYMAEALGQAGRIEDGLAAIDDAIGRAERTEELWQFAELLRLKGELILSQRPQRAAATAELLFGQALGWSRRQDALSWELRAATSLARLLRDRDRTEDAHALLQPVIDRFTEGFDTADLKAAKAILGTSRPPTTTSPKVSMERM
jgi:predicted ATPase/DNA-binding winged helix-turn-helix (wHTH) protein